MYLVKLFDSLLITKLVPWKGPLAAILQRHPEFENQLILIQ